MRTVCCLICESTFDEGDQCAVEGKHSGALYGVCPTCRKHAEIGKRVSQLAYIKRGGEDANYCEGWNDAISEAKGPNE